VAWKESLLDTTLPAGMIARLDGLGAELVRIATSKRDGTLEELEQGVLEAVRAVLPRLLEEVLTLSSSAIALGTMGARAACPECGEKRGVKEWRERTVKTVCGVVSFERPWYVCPQCRVGWSPVDERLQLPPRARLSGGLLEWLVRLGATSTSFVEAAGNLGRLTGLEVSPDTVRTRSEERGGALEEAEERAKAIVAATQEPAEALEKVPGKMVIETDGVMVRYLDGWHEVKVGLVGGHAGDRLSAVSYVAARESAEEFGPRLLAEAARRGALEVVKWQGPLGEPGLATLTEVVMLGDGAVWIWNLAAEHFGRRIEIVDFYHASEHLWSVAKALYGEGSDLAKAWGERQVRRLLAEGVGPVLAAIGRGKAPGEEGAATIKREGAYLRTNAARMDYPAFKEQGLPIGSGAVESSAKHLVQSRLKRPGARWSNSGAESILALRCRIASGRPIAA
jgi:Uncharacterised protein family (UPF0236)